jgi:hypothetical protein
MATENSKSIHKWSRATSGDVECLFRIFGSDDWSNRRAHA